MAQDPRHAFERHAPAGDGDRVVLTDGGFSAVDMRRVRRYSRLAAVIPAVLLVTVPPLIAWLFIRLFDLDIGMSWIVGVTILAIVVGILRVRKAERRLNGYHVLLADDALVFEFGGTRTFLDLARVQIVDREASLLLRLCGLCRLSLHTAGGTVVVSPLPVEVPPLVEHLVHARASDPDRAR